MPNIRLINAQDSLRYAQGMPEIFTIYARVMPKICRRYTNEMPMIYPRYAQDLTKSQKHESMSHWLTSASKNTLYKKNDCFPFHIIIEKNFRWFTFSLFLFLVLIKSQICKLLSIAHFAAIFSSKKPRQLQSSSIFPQNWSWFFYWVPHIHFFILPFTSLFVPYF